MSMFGFLRHLGIFKTTGVDVFLQNKQCDDIDTSDKLDVALYLVTLNLLGISILINKVFVQGEVSLVFADEY